MIAIGPRTSEKEFFEEHLDTTIPALSDIPECVQNGDMVNTSTVPFTLPFSAEISRVKRG